MKTVYACFTTDIIHEGHINLLAEARKHGRVIVGALADEALIRSYRFPTITEVQRVELYKRLENVDQVIIQNSLYYDDVLMKIKPDYVIHGDEWKYNELAQVRKRTIGMLESYGAELIEIPYTRNERVKKIEKQLIEKLSMPEFRRRRLRQLLEIYPSIKIIGVHNGLTGLIAEKTIVNRDGILDQFDGMWMSSLCDSTDKGKPDIELVDLTSRLRTVEDIMEVTTKPIIFDGDTGGIPEHFAYMVRTLERVGCSAVIIEDKKGLKRNSLFGTDVSQLQDEVDDFCHKIEFGKKAQLSEEFMIIARIESLILEKGMEDALYRAKKYREAGADGIMIHSKKKSPDEICEFLCSFRMADKSTPLIVVPTSYNEITIEQLQKQGANIVIFANQLMRAAYPAMKSAAEDLLYYHRSKEVDKRILPFKDIITLIDEI